MTRQSRSPPPHRDYYSRREERSRNSSRYLGREDRHRENDALQSDRSERQKYGNEFRGERDRGNGIPKNDERRRDYGRSSGGGGGRDRERERERERERLGDRERNYHRDGDRGPTRRHCRSTSPPPRVVDSRPPASPPQQRSTSPIDKAKPNFTPSGLLAAATNTVNTADGTSTLLKYNEPPEARKPVLRWRLYVFKGSEQVELLHIHRQSAYLIGRDRTVADISVDHPSCSKQHAVIQYRHVQEKDELGGSKGVIKPFIIDLESTNGTHVNDAAIPVSRFYELKPSDVIKFGQSTREYVLLHDEAQ